MRSHVWHNHSDGYHSDTIILCCGVASVTGTPFSTTWNYGVGSASCEVRVECTTPLADIEDYT
eukprot:6092494-Pyramimonas_sp.AAC.1